MAGYKITFDGSLNERRDVTEVTTTDSVFANTITQDPLGGGTLFNGPLTGGADYYVRSWIGLPDFEYRWNNVNITLIATGLSFVIGNYTYYGVNFQVNSDGYAYWDIRRELTNIIPVTIAESTPVPGAAPTPGTPTTETITTIQQGFVGIPGPVSPIEVKTLDGAQVAAVVKVHQPTESAEDAIVDSKNKKIITATGTTLDTQVTGLDVTNVIEANETVIQVIELLDATEN